MDFRSKPQRGLPDRNFIGCFFRLFWVFFVLLGFVFVLFGFVFVLYGVFFFRALARKFFWALIL